VCWSEPSPLQILLGHRTLVRRHVVHTAESGLRSIRRSLSVLPLCRAHRISLSQRLFMPLPCIVLLSEEATTPPPTLCPRCAGLLHLYIHTMEMSRHPERALQAADQLRELVPDSGHLCHMPTHIDIQCGHYRDVVVGTLLFVFVAESTS
jgi:hypothetical protein